MSGETLKDKLLKKAMAVRRHQKMARDHRDRAQEARKLMFHHSQKSGAYWQKAGQLQEELTAEILEL